MLATTHQQWRVTTHDSTGRKAKQRLHHSSHAQTDRIGRSASETFSSWIMMEQSCVSRMIATLYAQ